MRARAPRGRTPGRAGAARRRRSRPRVARVARRGDGTVVRPRRPCARVSSVHRAAALASRSAPLLRQEGREVGRRQHEVAVAAAAGERGVQHVGEDLRGRRAAGRVERREVERLPQEPRDARAAAARAAARRSRPRGRAKPARSSARNHARLATRSRHVSPRAARRPTSRPSRPGARRALQRQGVGLRGRERDDRQRPSGTARARADRVPRRSRASAA